MRLAKEINSLFVPPRKVGIFWLGQAGFVFKTPRNKLIVVDAYLSDCCQKVHGFKRIVPSLINPEELKADLIICTHAHLDHFDVDSIPSLMKASKAFLAGPESVIEESKKLNLESNRLILLKEGDRRSFNDFSIRAVYADHSDLAPDALGVVIDFDGLSIYYTGDTGYKPEKIKRSLGQKTDLIIFPINGKFGNLDPSESARLAADIGVKVAIPCHFWTFIEHGGDPMAFMEALKKFAPGCSLKLLAIGEGFIFPA
ncbi:MAG: MBL fold metallo-hydrolase [Actinobacteria bacterium]|nr:MBL fold metallo-hydrolase [Actinomycetota bacterium]